MAEERKRFLKGLVSQKRETSRASRETSVVASPKEGGSASSGRGGGNDERVRYLASMAAARKRNLEPNPETVAVADESGVAVEFTLPSLHEFTSRGLFSGRPSTAVRKRPNYDNRLRRLNKKASNRIAILDMKSTCFISCHCC